MRGRRAKPVSAGVLTTPGVAWLVSQEGFSAGVVISASHNPYHDNGVKLISASGMKFPDASRPKSRRISRAKARETSRESSRRARSITSGDEKLDEDYLAGLREAVLPGGKARGNENRARLRQWRRQQARAAAFPLAGRERDRDQQPAGRPQHQHADAVRFIRKRCKSGWSRPARHSVWRSTATPTAPCSSTASGKRVDGDGVLLAAGRYLKSIGQAEGRTRSSARPWRISAWNARSKNRG